MLFIAFKNFIKNSLEIIIESQITQDVISIIIMVVISLLIIVCVLVYTAFITVFERKVLASLQKRKGPNVVGFLGLLQAVADGLKLFAKETLIPGRANKVLFICSPIIVFFISLVGWAVIPFSSTSGLVDFNLGLLILFALSILNVYGVLIAGWAGNSRLPFLGALRSIAQMLAYDLSLGTNVMIVALYSNSFNLYGIIQFQQNAGWLVFLAFPSAVLFFICILAELKRLPFDLPEAESELVSGYNTEYSGFLFAFFFLAEYSSLILFANLFAILYLGGWAKSQLFVFFFGENYWNFVDFLFYNFKVIFILFIFIALRGTVCRFRYDSLMELGWKIFLPASLAYFLLTVILIYF